MAKLLQASAELMSCCVAAFHLFNTRLVYIDGQFRPQHKEIACWITNGDNYNALIQGIQAGNQQISGDYAVTTERLLQLLCAERV